MKSSFDSQIILKWSLIFPILLFPLFLCIVHLRRPSFLSLLFCGNSAFSYVYLSLSPLPFASLLSSANWKASLNTYFAFLHFFFFGMVLVTASCAVLCAVTIVPQALCLPDLIPWIYLSPLMYNHKGFDLDYTWMAFGFLYFLKFKSEFCSKEFMLCCCCC